MEFSSTAWKEARRLQALALRQNGWKQTKIAEASGVTDGAVSQWFSVVDAQDGTALWARPHTGRPPALTREQKDLIPNLLSHGAEAYGFRGDVWTNARVAKVIEWEYVVSYHPSHIARLLKALKWTPQLPLVRNDSLTGMESVRFLKHPLAQFDRRYMEETIERELHRAARNATPLGIIIFDIDHFKQLNDSFGHGAGDAILHELGAWLESRIRREDIACRYGGDEFVLVLPECSLDATRDRAIQLRRGLKNLNVAYGGQSLPLVSLSLGVAISPVHGTNAEALLQTADQALYRAKAGGRDRVVVAE